MKKLFGTNNKKRLLPVVNRLAVCLGLLLACAVLYGQDVPTVPQTAPPDTNNVLPVASADDTTAAQTPAVAPAAVPTEQEPVDTDVVPKQGPVTPNVDQEIVASDEVYTVHLRPLFTAVVRLPEAVTSLAVGAPTLIAAEHDKAEPHLVFIKPTTHKKVDSNVIVALQSGHTLAIRVISAGDEGSSDPVDFVVDYSQPRGLMLGSNEIDTPLYPARPSAPAPAPEASPAGQQRSGQLIQVSTPRHNDVTPEQQPGHRQAGTSTVTDQTPVATIEPHSSSKPLPLLDSIYQEQLSVAAPHYTTAEELSRIYPEDKNASADLSASIGRCVQTGDNVTLSYSVLNRSERWIEVLPPLLEFNNPTSTKKNGKVDKKHPEALAESLPISDYRMSKTKLAPGERMDGALEFVRPGFKFRKERLLLQIANASEVDTALLVPVPFVPVGHE
jgi:hypothetical protein